MPGRRGRCGPWRWCRGDGSQDGRRGLRDGSAEAPRSGQPHPCRRAGRPVGPVRPTARPAALGPVSSVPSVPPAPPRPRRSCHEPARTRVMSAQPDAIACATAPGARAVVIRCGTGWRASDARVLPRDLACLPLPPCVPALNPIGTLRAPCAPTATASPRHPGHLGRHRLPLSRRLDRLRRRSRLRPVNRPSRPCRRGRGSGPSGSHGIRPPQVVRAGRGNRRSPPASIAEVARHAAAQADAPIAPTGRAD
jgi:hypothetical protein